MMMGLLFLMMNSIVEPTLAVSVSFDLDLKYDPFKGRSIEQYLALFEDDLKDVLYELVKVQEVYNLHIQQIND